jgi:hypothetical protein
LTEGTAIEIPMASTFSGAETLTHAIQYPICLFLGDDLICYCLVEGFSLGFLLE